MSQFQNLNPVEHDLQTPALSLEELHSWYLLSPDSMCPENKRKVLEFRWAQGIATREEKEFLFNLGGEIK